MTATKLLVGAVALSLAIVTVPLAMGAERPDDRMSRPTGSAAAEPTTTVVMIGSADRIVERLQAGLDAYGRPLRSATPGDDPADRPVGGAPVPTTAETRTGATTDDVLWVAGIAALVAALSAGIAVAVVHTHHGGPRRPTTAH